MTEVFRLLLENVQTLLLDLFELVLHFYDDLLDFCVVGLRTCCVDLAAHFLSDEAELLAGALLA